MFFKNVNLFNRFKKCKFLLQGANKKKITGRKTKPTHITGVYQPIYPLFYYLINQTNNMATIYLYIFFNYKYIYLNVLKKKYIYLIKNHRFEKNHKHKRFKMT
jgi:hypothetical protein